MQYIIRNLKEGTTLASVESYEEAGRWIREYLLDHPEVNPFDFAYYTSCR